MAAGDRSMASTEDGTPGPTDSYQVEHRVLQAIHRRLPIPTPGVEHAGELEGWGYLLMERLHGQPLTTAWPLFLAQQRAGCVDHQRAAGLHGAWLEQIPAFLDSATLDPVPRPVLLHTEVMREHLLVTPHPDGWSLSGLLDFEPAMRGAREYEFAAVGLFVSRGDTA